MSSVPKPLPHIDDADLYPDSDGQPMGETDWHIWALILLREGLEDFFAAEANVCIASDMFLYYVEGDPSACLAPDTMVIRGVPKHFRRTFKTWVEKAVPNAVIEIVSEKTIREDRGIKLTRYEQMGVGEYFLFDPEAEHLRPPLQGFRLRGKKYRALKPAADGSLTSKELGLRLIREGHMLRLIDERTNLPVLTRQEAKEQAERSAAQRVEQAEQERDQAKQHAAELEAELARLRAAQAKRKGKHERDSHSG